MARFYDPEACKAHNDAGQPYSLLLEPHQLMTAQLEYKKVEAAASDPGKLVPVLESLEPFGPCPACAEVPGDCLEDGRWLRSWDVVRGGSGGGGGLQGRCGWVGGGLATK